MKNKSLDIATKIKIITEIESGMASKKDTAKKYGIPQSTLSTILKHKNAIKESETDINVNINRKRNRGTKYADLEKNLVVWIKAALNSKIPISGGVLRQKAVDIANSMGISGFSGSNGWFRNFKYRNQIAYKVISGEAKDVNIDTIENWRENVFREIYARYKEKDIFNADETGLFFKVLPNKTFAFKNELCIGGKVSKERVTVLLCANFDGSEKLTPLVIGKFAKPRCLTGIKILPVLYDCNMNSWMTSKIFEEWLHSIDKKFRKEERNVVLLVDNCASHPPILCRDLTNIRIEFLPPNTTSKIQPLDQGIIKNFKHFYRKKTVRRLLNGMDVGIRQDINLLHCLIEVKNSWNSVSAETIRNCFLKGLISNDNSDTIEYGTENADDEFINSDWMIFKDLVQCEILFEDYLSIDNNIVVNEVPFVSTSEKNNQAEAVNELAEDSSHEEKISVFEAKFFANKLQLFLMQRDDVKTDVNNAMETIQEYFERLNIRKKQRKITDYFFPN